MSILLAIWSYRKWIGYALIAIFLTVSFYRIKIWHAGYIEAVSLKSQLADADAYKQKEEACKEASTSCARHLEQLRLDSQNAVNEAVQAEQKKEAIARDAQQKREQETEQQHAKELSNATKKLNDANAQLAHDIATDDSCTKWAAEKVACQLYKNDNK